MQRRKRLQSFKIVIKLQDIWLKPSEPALSYKNDIALFYLSYHIMGDYLIKAVNRLLPCVKKSQKGCDTSFRLCRQISAE